MASYMADVVVHIDEDTTPDEREALRDLFLQHTGVMAADYRDDRPHLMIIEYDPEAVASADLLQVAQRKGLHAELVGM